MTLELTSASTVRVQEIQYSSTASTSTEYEYPSPGPESIKTSLKFIPKGPINNIGSDNGLNQWCLVYCCIYASLGLNELTTYSYPLW